MMCACQDLKEETQFPQCQDLMKKKWKLTCQSLVIRKQKRLALVSYRIPTHEQMIRGILFFGHMGKVNHCFSFMQNQTY